MVSTPTLYSLFEKLRSAATAYLGLNQPKNSKIYIANLCVRCEEFVSSLGFSLGGRPICTRFALGSVEVRFL